MPKKKQRKQEGHGQGERLRAILGSTGDRLPRVGLDTLRRFHGYLAAHQPFPFEARLSDPAPQARAGDYTATIYWGDGSTSAGLVTGSDAFQVAGSHTYAGPGGFTVGIVLHNNRTNVAEAALTSAVALSANACFVSQLYHDLLGRDADPPGLAFWTATLDQGVSRSQVARAIAGSLEYRVDTVENLYATLLDRPADPGGLNTFVQFLGQGGTIEQAEAMIIGSAEYLQARAGGSDAGFLNALYHDVLGRSVDPLGATVWGGLLDLGLSRDVVADLVLDSLEARQDRVQGFYELALHRAADAGGLDTFSTALGLGLRDEDVLAVIMGSDEYFARCSQPG